MTDDSEGPEDLADLSDEEIQELSEEVTREMPKAMGKAMGLDLLGEFDEEGQEEFEEDFSEHLKEVLTGFRDGIAKESEEEQAVAMFDVYDQMTEKYLIGTGEEGVDGGFEMLIETLRLTLEDSRKAMEELGHSKYFEIINEFAVDIVEAGKDDEVKEFFDGLEDNSQQILLQRVYNPLVMEYYAYIEEHPDITDADEARNYIDMYYELAELFEKILPQFIAVLQIASGKDDTYNDLKQMNLNNLLQKLESNKYSRFNDLAEGIDRKLRNSIAHRDFKIDPIEEEIEFRDRGELVAELSYSDLQEEIFRLLALFTSVWMFRLMLTYYQIQHLPEAIDNLREQNADE